MRSKDSKFGGESQRKVKKSRIKLGGKALGPCKISGDPREQNLKRQIKEKGKALRSRKISRSKGAKFRGANTAEKVRR